MILVPYCLLVLGAMTTILSTTYTRFFLYGSIRLVRRIFLQGHCEEIGPEFSSWKFIQKTHLFLLSSANLTTADVVLLKNTKSANEIFELQFWFILYPVNPWFMNKKTMYKQFANLINSFTLFDEQNWALSGIASIFFSLFKLVH